MAKNLLSDTTLKNAKPKANGKVNRLNDGGHLYFYVWPDKKTWYLRYFHPVTLRETAMKLPDGNYPAMSAKKARELRDKFISDLVGDKVDPLKAKVEKKKAAIANGKRTFLAESEAWFDSEIKHSTPPMRVRSIAKNRYLLNTLQDEIGEILVTELTTADVAAMVERVRRRLSLDYAGRMIRMTSRVLSWCITAGLIKYDVTQPVAEQFAARSRLVKGGKKNRPAVARTGSIEQKIDKVAILWRKICAANGTFGKAATKFLMLTLVRPGEVANAEWSEIDLKHRVWTIPADKMKMDKDHVVALSDQAVAILEQMKPLTGEGRWVFSTTGHSRKIGEQHIEIGLAENTINKLLRRVGYDTGKEQCAHGFRSSASTLLNEERRSNGDPAWHPDVVELSLAHVDDNTTRGIYNRAKLWPDRVRLMQHWADRLDTLRDGAKLLKLEKRA